MDRVHLVLDALAAGGASATEDASDAVNSAHADLKDLVRGHFGGRADEAALEQYEHDPAAGRARLKEVLESTGAVEDFPIVVAAQRLMKLVDPEGAAGGKYAVQPQSLPGLRIGH